MDREQKADKSPIQSILADSFDKKSRNYEQVIQGAQFQHSPGFSRSNGGLNVQIQLQYAQALSRCQLEAALTTFITIWSNKILNQMSISMNKIKIIAANSSQAHHRPQKALAMKKVQLIVQKMQNILKKLKIKRFSEFFTQLLLLKVRNSLDKCSSIVSPYRGYIKGEYSERGESEWELTHSQGEGQESQESPTIENKQLKKKRNKIKNNRQQFYTKMDQILSIHQTLLGKK